MVKVGPECLACIQNLIDKATELSTGDPELRGRARQQALGILQRCFSSDVVPAHLSTEILRALKVFTGSPDPFKGVKRREIDLARRVSSQIRPSQGLRSLVEYAALGNTLDFFKEPESLLETAGRFPGFARDDVDLLTDELHNARKILYLADNAGECYFDEPLVSHLARGAAVTFAVRSTSAQNDLTYDDLVYAGLADKFGEVITTGDDAIGVDQTTSSQRLIDELQTSDLVIAKGMGNYETLTELSFRTGTFYILMAKCRPVASSLGVPVDSYVAALG
jgi:hypothetical protein